MTKKPKQFTKKKNKKSIVIASLSAIILLVAMIVGICATAGPVTKLQKAAKKTFFAKNFTALFTLTVNEDIVDVILNAAIDPDNRKIDLYMQINDGLDDYVCGIYENTFVVCSASSSRIKTIDISQRLSAFFDALEKNAEPNWSLLLDFDRANLYSEISEDFTFSKFLTGLEAWIALLNDADWAKEFAGYQSLRENRVTYHRYRPDPHTFLSQSIPCFEDAFCSDDTYRRLQTFMDEAEYLLKRGKTDFSWGIKNGKLVSADFELEYHDTNIRGTATFLGIGSTVIDTESLQYYIKEAQKKA